MMGAVKNFYHDDLERQRCAADGEYEDAWIPALIAFYKADCAFMLAERLEKGWHQLDTYDLRQIEALKAALAVAP